MPNTGLFFFQTIKVFSLFIIEFFFIFRSVRIARISCVTLSLRSCPQFFVNLRLCLHPYKCKACKTRKTCKKANEIKWNFLLNNQNPNQCTKSKKLKSKVQKYKNISKTCQKYKKWKNMKKTKIVNIVLEKLQKIEKEKEQKKMQIKKIQQKI